MDPFLRHVFDAALAIARLDPRPPGVALGLSPAALAELYPGLSLEDDGTPCIAPEEEDLRALLSEYASAASFATECLVRIIARRAQEPNHLWQDLGLGGRDELSLLMRRHFAPLVRRNARDMKWKKFLYRDLCQREGVFVCKSPVCDSCADAPVCFGAEDGPAIVAKTTFAHDNHAISM